MTTFQQYPPNTYTEPIKVLHTITGLSMGGAEMTLYKMLSETDRRSFPAEVVALTGPGVLTEPIRELGIKVTHLDITRGHWPHPHALLRLFKTIRRFNPQVIQGWMYHGNLAAWLASRCLLKKRILAWNHRQSLYDLKLESKMTRLAIKAEIRLSSQVDVLINNSQRSLQQHLAKGYRPKKKIVIPNGFDLEKFRPNQEAGRAVRKALGVDDKTLLVGLVGREHPMKDLPNFVQAAVKVHGHRPDVVFVVVGNGWSKNDAGPGALVGRFNAGQFIRLLGPRNDIPRLMAAFDVTVSSSCRAEGFPNVIGESMAAGTPCVVTDVGDLGLLTGDTGEVVPPGDSTALCAGILKLLDISEDERQRLGQRARRRIETRYSLSAIVRQYEELYRYLAATPRR